MRSVLAEIERGLVRARADEGRIRANIAEPKWPAAADAIQAEEALLEDRQAGCSKHTSSLPVSTICSRHCSRLNKNLRTM
jgi:hypothetical protein